MKNKQTLKQSEKTSKNQYSFRALIIAFVIGYMTSSILIYVMPARQKEQNFTPMESKPVSKLAKSNTLSPLSALQMRTQSHPDEAQSWIQLGNYYYDTVQFQQAVNAYEKALELDRQNSNVLVDCGVMYRRLKRPDLAIDMFTEANDVDPSHQPALFNRGIVFYFDLGNTVEARSAWEKLLAINPDAQGPDGQPLRSFVDEMSTE